ncbi:MAG: Rrf2 family transcriptional regulator [Fibrobacteria bacterium]|nr:Rrf2 family transcriptional regulator [Fibrobacteria bacterium]
MLTTTKKSYYGVLALIDLAYHFEKGLLQIKEIAGRNNIPRNYLEQLLNRLLKSGLIRSIRGTKGGYALAKDPSTITLLQVIEAMEGEVSPSDFWSEFSPVEKIFSRVSSNVRDLLSVSLKELLEQKSKSDNISIYYI